MRLQYAKKEGKTIFFEEKKKEEGKLSMNIMI